MGLDQLDDHDYPALAVGQAAELLGVQAAFLRSLDNAGVVQPQRSHGGHRRYSRRQLARAARMRELFDQGHTLASAAQVLTLENDLELARAERDRAHQQRNDAREERDRAYRQRDEARQQRDQAYRQLDQAFDGGPGAPRGSVAPRPDSADAAVAAVADAREDGGVSRPASR
jgi:MerR family transcriptional regulator/heat shock protein HspR